MATTVKPAPIVLSIETPADIETAWEALTDPDRVTEWFTDVSPLGVAGDPYRIDFGDSSVEGVVVDVQPGRRFAHTWRWEGADADEQTLVAWTVEALPGAGHGSRWSTPAGRRPRATTRRGTTTPATGRRTWRTSRRCSRAECPSRRGLYVGCTYATPTPGAVLFRIEPHCHDGSVRAPSSSVRRRLPRGLALFIGRKPAGRTVARSGGPRRWAFQLTKTAGVISIPTVPSVRLQPASHLTVERRSASRKPLLALGSPAFHLANGPGSCPPRPVRSASPGVQRPAPR